jgi:hypothetical protein
MTELTATRPTSETRTAVGIGVATAVVSGVLVALFAHDWGEILVVLAAIAVTTAVVFGAVVPRGLRRESAGGAALTCGIVAALLALPAFWSGLPLVLGVAAMLLGNTGRTAAHGSGKCIAAIVLGALASVFVLAVYVMEAFAGNTGFLLS